MGPKERDDEKEMSDKAPILYSFRRCPFAIRARATLHACGVVCELREVSLKAKPPELLEASPKGTVPVLITPAGRVIEESLEVMDWALSKGDPLGWGRHWSSETARAVIERNDSYFKHHLDRAKYGDRYPGEDPAEHRRLANAFLFELEEMLARGPGIVRGEFGAVDVACLPFVRQFANSDKEAFAALELPRVKEWLAAFLDSELFARVMVKHRPWSEGDPVVWSEAAST